MGSRSDLEERPSKVQVLFRIAACHFTNSMHTSLCEFGIFSQPKLSCLLFSCGYYGSIACLNFVPWCGGTSVVNVCLLLRMNHTLWEKQVIIGERCKLRSQNGAKISLNLSSCASLFSSAERRYNNDSLCSTELTHSACHTLSGQMQPIITTMQICLCTRKHEKCISHFPMIAQLS